MELLLLLIVIFLAGYIVFLHLKLIKRDLLIRQLTGNSNTGRNLSEGTRSFADEYILEKNVLDFVFENINDARIYLHYTKNRNDAENILKEGFKFAESFYKTAFQVTGDRLELIVKHNSKKYFGDYVVVICISEKIIRFYNDEIIRAGVKNCHFENILTERPPSKNDNADTVYILPSKYIKGYFNYTTGELFPNPDFDYNYTSPWFKINLEKLLL